jgi:hypothetical protein
MGRLCSGGLSVGFGPGCSAGADSSQTLNEYGNRSALHIVSLRRPTIRWWITIRCNLTPTFLLAGVNQAHLRYRVIRPGDRLAGFRKAVGKHVATWRVLFEVQIRCSLNSQCAILNRHGTARMAYLITVSKREALSVYRQPTGPKMEILDKMSARREVIGDDWISRSGCRKACV